MTSKLIEALNKCEIQKSYENVRYTLIDDELRAYIEESLERLEALENENDKYKWQERVLNDILTGTKYDAKEIMELLIKVKNTIEILKSFIFVSGDVDFDSFVTSNYTEQQIEELKAVFGL
jgi:uncharacterized protein (UPF0335 family)